MRNLLQRIGKLWDAFITRHIVMKIWLHTAVLGLTVILCLYGLIQVFFRNYILEDALQRAEHYTNNAAEFSSRAVDDIVNSFVRNCGSTERFRNLVPHMKNDTGEQRKWLYLQLQEFLEDLSDCHPLVTSSVFVTRSGNIYAPLSRSLSGTMPTYDNDEILKKLHRVTILPAQKGIMWSENWVIPMAIPLGIHPVQHNLQIMEDGKLSDTVCYIFLDAAQLNETLSLYNPYRSEGEYFLMNGAGEVLNYAEDSEEEKWAGNINLGKTVSQLAKEEQTAPVRLGEHYVFCRQISQRDLYMVLLVTAEGLMTPMSEINKGIFALVIAAIVTSVFAMLAVAMNLAKPLKVLTRSVQAISDGVYSSDMVMHQTDEIGQLSRTVDSMYCTIQAQMNEIRDERQAKFNAEMRVLSEQINPHFLYNTLEYINMEVYNHHNENASTMIQSLGDFLRISLNFGKEEIAIEKELEHVCAYIAIMNQRFQQKIMFTINVPEEMRRCSVLKIILQPLVENSIRHGFMIDGSNAFIEIPSIRIRGSMDEAFMRLSVVDNGVGFDVEKTRKTMLEEPTKQKHVGLNNVYHRLRLYYGEGVDIEMQSIPYYRNTVTICIPLQHPRLRETGENMSS